MKRFLLALPVVVLIAAGCNSSQPVSSQTPVTTPVAQTPTVTPTPTPTAAPVKVTPTLQPSPTQAAAPAQPTLAVDVPLGDLKLFTFPAAGTTTYYQAQNFSVNGASLILASTYGEDGCDGAGCTTSIFRFLKDGSSYTLLVKYSDALGGSGQNVSQQDLAVTATSNQDVPALDFPTSVTDPNSKAVVTYEPDGQQSGVYGQSFLEGDLFSASGKTAVFSAQGYTFYALSGNNSETFYTESADGKQLVYTLTSPSIANISWDAGVQNQPSYVVDGSCTGLDGYGNALAKTTVLKSDLTAVGTIGGTQVYELSNPQNPLIVGLRSDVQSFNQSQINANGGSSDEPDGTTLVLYPPVTQTTVLFWSDPFGRLIRLIDTRQFSACVN